MRVGLKVFPVGHSSQKEKLSMEAWTNHLLELFLTNWQSATMADYGHLVLAIVLVGWGFTRCRA